MDPGLVNAKTAIMQALEPMRMLKKRSLRLFKIKDFADFNFITFIITEIKNGKKKYVDKEQAIIYISVIMDLIKYPDLYFSTLSSRRRPGSMLPILLFALRFLIIGPESNPE